jgi:hypothetical protein
MQMSTRSVAKATVVAIMTALAALIIAIMQSLTTAVTASLGLTAFQAIVVPGTGTPDPYVPKNYLNNAVNYYVYPGGDCGAANPTNCPATVTGVKYYATFWPIPLPGWGGLSGQKWNVSVGQGVEHLGDAYTEAKKSGEPIVIFGYSQGATVATNFKRENANDPYNPKTDYFFIGDPQRPSGGFFERFAFLGNVPILDAQFGDPAPTDTCVDDSGKLRTCATDLALQYDGVADFPQWLANPLAVANAVAGFAYIHGTYLAPDADDPSTETPYGYTPEEIQGYITEAQKPGGCDVGNPNHCQHVEGSDTIYITLPARTLPLYQPVLDLGSATGTSALVIPLVDLVQPATQTLIETGYDRTDYSKPQPGTLLPPKTFNPIQTAGDLVKDVPLGINNALTPGLQPLPGSDTNPNVVVTDNPLTTTAAGNNQAVSTAAVTNTNPLLRLSTIAKPGGGASNATGSGSSANRPLGNALKDFHPVRDVVKAVSGTVNKALGNGDNSASADKSKGVE